MNASLPMPVLADGSIRIRPWMPGDESSLFEAARESIATVGRWLPWLKDDYSPADSASWVAASGKAWREGQEFRFAILESQSDKVLGGVGLNRLNRDEGLVNLGYWVRSSATGRGVASRAARLAARFALTELGLVRVEVLMREDNIGSRRVAEKLGAHFEGTLRDCLWTEGEVYPARLYSLVRDNLPGSLSAGSD